MADQIPGTIDAFPPAVFLATTAAMSLPDGNGPAGPCTAGSLIVGNAAAELGGRRAAQGKPASGQVGFSLLEILIVLAAAMVVLAMAVPVATTIIARNRLNLAAQQIVVQMQFARMKAISSNEIIQVNFPEGREAFQVQSAEGTIISGPFFLPRGLTWNAADGGTGLTFAGGYVAFQEAGDLPSAGNGSSGRVKLISDSGDRIDVVVRLGGLIRQTPVYTSPPAPF